MKNGVVHADEDVNLEKEEHLKLSVIRADTVVAGL